MSFPPPNDTKLAEVDKHQLAFFWTPVSYDCHYLHYNIISSNCGDCPTESSSSSVTCRNVSVTKSLHYDDICTFAVQPVVCNNIRGSTSRPITTNLKGINFFFNFKVTQ